MRELEEIRALCDAATPGPWESTADAVGWHESKARGERNKGASILELDGNNVILGGVVTAGWAFGVLSNNDAEFIAASRMLIPEMLDALVAEQENANDLEGCLSAGQMVLCAQNATIANLREEIEQLRADLAQSHAATEKLSRGLWKDC